MKNVKKRKKRSYHGSETLRKYRSRAMRANDLIRVIASHGRRFFAQCSDMNTPDKEMTGRISYFEVNNQGHIFFVNAYKLSRVYLNREKYYWRHWQHGGTLKDLVEALRDYIKTGEPIPGHLGPHPQWYSQGDPWGYGEESMGKVRDAAVRLGIYPKEKKKAVITEVESGEKK